MKYSFVTMVIWMLENFTDWLNTRLQHLRVKSQLRDIDRVKLACPSPLK